VLRATSARCERKTAAPLSRPGSDWDQMARVNQGAALGVPELAVGFAAVARAVAPAPQRTAAQIRAFIWCAGAIGGPGAPGRRAFMAGCSIRHRRRSWAPAHRTCPRGADPSDRPAIRDGREAGPGRRRRGQASRRGARARTPARRLPDRSGWESVRLKRQPNSDRLLGQWVEGPR